MDQQEIKQPNPEAEPERNGKRSQDPEKGAGQSIEGEIESPEENDAPVELLASQESSVTPFQKALPAGHETNHECSISPSSTPVSPQIQTQEHHEERRCRSS